MTLRAVIALLIGLAGARVAAADPMLGRVETAPTAWLPAAGAVTATASANEAGLDHGGDGDLVFGYGLGGLAEVDLGTDTDVRRCTAACDTTKPAPIFLGRAAFRIGARQDEWFAGQPAAVFGVRTTFAGSVDVGEAYLVASRVVGPLHVHLGGELIAAAAGAQQLPRQLRPLAGIEWTPWLYPKTMVVGDVSWVPLFANATDPPRLEYLTTWGVRYQAFSWGSIELAVRHRQDTGLGDSTVMVRVNGVWAR